MRGALLVGVALGCTPLWAFAPGAAALVFSMVFVWAWAELAREELDAEDEKRLGEWEPRDLFRSRW